MKTILQFAFASFSRLDMGSVRSLWAAIERMVAGFERDNFRQISGPQKVEDILARVGNLIPPDRREIGTQVIRAIVEIVLIGIRRNGGRG